MTCRSHPRAYRAENGYPSHDDSPSLHCCCQSSRNITIRTCCARYISAPIKGLSELPSSVHPITRKPNLRYLILRMTLGGIRLDMVLFRSLQFKNESWCRK